MSNHEQQIALRRLIRRQHGIVSLEQALAAGHTRTTVGHKVKTKAWFPVGAELIALADGGARSWAERELHRRMRAAGITGWSANLQIELPGFGRAVADVAVEEEKVVVEVDGWAFHRDLRAFLRDGPRQSALAATGRLVLRTHWYELRDDPDAFLGRLRATLRARSWSVERTSSWVQHPLQESGSSAQTGPPDPAITRLPAPPTWPRRQHRGGHAGKMGR